MKYVILGAQGVALGAYNSIKKLFPSKKILGYLRGWSDFFWK